MSELPPQSVFFGLALIAALVTVVVASLRARLDVGIAFGVFSLAIMGVAGGARLLWCVASPEAGLSVVWERPSLIWHPLKGGYASFGGWLGAGLVGWLAVRGWSWRRRWAYADVFVPSGLVGMAVARLGCLSHGCDFGVVYEWGLRYVPDTPAFRAHVEKGLITADAARSLPTFPFPIVMAVATFVIAIVALIPRKASVGRAAAGAAGAYFGARLVLETFRAPETVHVLAGPLNVNHVFAIFGLVATVMIWRRYGRVEDSQSNKTG